jgi:guanine deaminase
MDTGFMKMAIAKAYEGIDSGQTPFGACIVRDGEVISCCHNQVWQDTDITAHAEIVAIRQACSKLNSVELEGCDIYSTCEPCPMCFSACHWAGISTIYYGAAIGDAESAGFNELTVSNRQMVDLGGSRVKLVPGVLQAECVLLFKKWIAGANKKTY